MRTETFPGRFESLQKISDFVVQAAQEAGLNPSAVYAVDLAVDEACTNIIEHAYGGEGRGEISCTCKATEKGLVVILCDRGRPFKPERVPPPNINTRLKNLKAGGAGLFLMQKMMDEVHFKFSSETGNVLTMFKKKT